MKYILLSVMMLILLSACTKADNAHGIPRKYEGKYHITHLNLSGTTPTHGQGSSFDTTYYYDIEVTYKRSDRIDVSDMAHEDKKMHKIVFKPVNNEMPVQEFGIDNLGKLYLHHDNHVDYVSGGFVSDDSINVSYGIFGLSFYGKHILTGTRFD